MATELPGDIIGYRKNGLPIRLIAGGAPEDGNTPTTPQGTGRFYSQEEFDQALAAARQAELDKLNPRISQSDERTKAMQAELKELRDFQKKQEKAEADRIAAVEKARKAAEEAELSAKELIERRQAEADARLAEFQAQQSQQLALLHKEIEFQKLGAYIQRRINEEQDTIAPELLGYIDGKTEEEVEASIARVQATTASIIEGMRSAGVRQRAAMPGVAPAAGTNGVGPMDTPGDRQYSAEDIEKMGMKEYSELRARVGIGGANNQGLFRA